MLDVILKLKKTTTPQFPGPMGWREIGRRLGMSGPGARWHAEKALKDPKHPRCPCCLQKLELEKHGVKQAGSVTEATPTTQGKPCAGPQG